MGRWASESQSVREWDGRARARRRATASLGRRRVLAASKKRRDGCRSKSAESRECMLLSRPAHRWDAKSSTGQDQDPILSNALVWSTVAFGLSMCVRGACRLRVSGV